MVTDSMSRKRGLRRAAVVRRSASPEVWATGLKLVAPPEESRETETNFLVIWVREVEEEVVAPAQEGAAGSAAIETHPTVKIANLILKDMRLRL